MQCRRRYHSHCRRCCCLVSLLQGRTPRVHRLTECNIWRVPATGLTRSRALPALSSPLAGLQAMLHNRCSTRAGVPQAGGGQLLAAAAGIPHDGAAPARAAQAAAAPRARPPARFPFPGRRHGCRCAGRAATHLAGKSARGRSAREVSSMAAALRARCRGLLLKGVAGMQVRNSMRCTRLRNLVIRVAVCRQVYSA